MAPLKELKHEEVMLALARASEHHGIQLNGPLVAKITGRPLSTSKFAFAAAKEKAKEELTPGDDDDDTQANGDTAVKAGAKKRKAPTSDKTKPSSTSSKKRKVNGESAGTTKTSIMRDNAAPLNTVTQRPLSGASSPAHVEMEDSEGIKVEPQDSDFV